MEHGNTPQNESRSLPLKILSAVGFILVLVFGAWGIIQVGRSLPHLSSALSGAAASITSLFIPAERLSISIPSANINSGEPFTLSWNHTGKRSPGTYTVSFECRDGLTMQAIGETGVYQSISCNTPFNLTNTTTEVSLVATSLGARFLDVPFKVEFTRLSDGTIAAAADATLTVTNNAFVEPSSNTPTTPLPTTPTQPTPSTPTPTTPAPTKPVTQAPSQPAYTTYVTTGRVSNPYGNPDLAVTILDVGTVYNNYGYNYNSGYYASNYTIRRGDLVTVRFVVENTGTKTVDTWNFNAVLPTMPMNIYSSDMQPALAPGDKMQFTLQFDQADSASTNGALTINVDPSNMLWNELNKNNNVARAYLTILNN